MATWWIQVARAEQEGTRCRDSTLADVDGQVLATARAFDWRRVIAVEWRREASAVVATGGSRLPARLVRRRTFPFTGKVDVLGADEVPIGVLSRRGVVRDAAGVEIGRFRDVRTWKDFAGEGLLDLAGAVLTGSADDQAGSAPAAFAWVVGGRNAGTLSRAHWPFGGDPPEHGSGWLRRFLGRLGRPQGWRLELTTAAPDRDRLPLVLAAALWQVELAGW